MPKANGEYHSMPKVDGEYISCCIVAHDRDACGQDTPDKVSVIAGGYGIRSNRAVMSLPKNKYGLPVSRSQKNWMKDTSPPHRMSYLGTVIQL